MWDSSQEAAVLSAQRYLIRIIILLSIGAISPTPLDDLVPQKKNMTEGSWAELQTEHDYRPTGGQARPV